MKFSNNLHESMHNDEWFIHVICVGTSYVHCNHCRHSHTVQGTRAGVRHAPAIHMGDTPITRVQQTHTSQLLFKRHQATPTGANSLEDLNYARKYWDSKLSCAFSSNQHPGTHDNHRPHRFLTDGSIHNHSIQLSIKVKYTLMLSHACWRELFQWQACKSQSLLNYSRTIGVHAQRR